MLPVEERYKRRFVQQLEDLLRLFVVDVEVVVVRAAVDKYYSLLFRNKP